MATTTCSIEGCGSTVIAKGLCRSHYNTARMAAKRAERRESLVRPCKQCQAEFSGRDPRALFCSPSCKDDYFKRHRVRKSRRAPIDEGRCCMECGASIAMLAPQARFCSRDCGREYRERQARAEINAQRVCQGCGGPMGEDDSLRRQYCTSECRTRNARAMHYGIPLAEYTALLAAQGGGCAICGTTDWPGKGPEIDHCHTEGHVRGILCTNCNNGLGRFADDPEMLRQAADYLEGAFAPV